MYYKAFIIMCLFFGALQAQDIQFVNAENGLALREKPNRSAPRLGVLDYGTALEVVEHTNIEISVMDDSIQRKGAWVKVRSIDAYDTFEGYVFNGFLTEKKLKRHYKIPFKEFTIYVQDFDNYLRLGLSDNLVENDTIRIPLDLGETIQNKTIRIKHHQEFRTIEVFQKHENSITVMNEGPHCDLVNYEHYLSAWKPLKVITNNKQFKTKEYTEKDWNKFLAVDLDNLKTHVKDYCGETWYNLIKDVSAITDYPLGVTMSKIYLRVVMTDIDGHKTEKIIIFEIPMGC